MELSSFVLMYFSLKRVSLLTAFICGKPDLSLWLWRSSVELGIRVRTVSEYGIPPTLQAVAVEREGVLLDLSCPQTSLVLAQASESKAFNSRHSWLLLDHSDYNRSYLEEVLFDSLIFPDAEVMWSSPDVSAEMYRVKANQPLLITELGIGRNIKMLTNVLAQSPSKNTKRKDLKNIYLKAATIISQPQYFKGWTDLSNRYVDTWTKIAYPLMMTLAHDLHLRYVADKRLYPDIVEKCSVPHANLPYSKNKGKVFLTDSLFPRVDLYGEERNGSFDGLAGMLERSEIEIGICSMFMRNDRWRVMHYSSEVTDLRGAFMFRQPSQSAVSNMFLLPFSRGVWAASMTIFAGVALILAIVCKRLTDLDQNLEMLTPMETFTFAVGTICQQGFFTTPDLASIRVMMFFTLTTSLFVFTSYSAKIVAILQSPSNAIQTIDDITRSPMGVGVQETTYKKTYFAESTEPATQALYRKKLLPLGDRAYMSAVEGIERMRTGLFAFQVEEGSGYDVISKTFTESEKCGLMQIQAFKMPMVAVPIKKQSGYKELMAVRLRWHREVGLISQLRRVWLAEKPRCDANAAGGFVTVGLRDVTPALHALFIGYAAAIIIFVVEFFAKKGCKTRCPR